MSSTSDSISTSPQNTTSSSPESDNSTWIYILVVVAAFAVALLVTAVRKALGRPVVQIQDVYISANELPTHMRQMAHNDAVRLGAGTTALAPEVPYTVELNP